MNMYELIGKSRMDLVGNLDENWKNVEILGITDDSRKVKPGYLFVAIKGLENNGHDYIIKAVETGAVAVVYENGSKVPEGKYVAIEATDNRRTLGLLWTAWYDFPSNKLKIIGITGTDGKTTTTNILYHILKTAGRKVGMVSTINARFGDREVDTGFHVTNPEPELLQRLLSEMAGEGLEYVCLEVTSHGIDQGRIAGVKFYGAVITNVTHEHLDYHKTYQNYLETKGKLFKGVTFSILNKDDESYEFMRLVSSGKLISYGLNNFPDVLADKVDLANTGSRFQITLPSHDDSGDNSILHSIEVSLQIPGSYNVSNALAASSAALELGLTLQEIKIGLESFDGLKGRFEEIKAGQLFKVIVDFAHTPNALEQVLSLSSKLKVENGKLIVVFGCAGERDKEKRQMMGEISGRLADVSILTAEDPRRENLDDIINEIANGCLRSGAHEVNSQELVTHNLGNNRCFLKISDRRQAIETALSLAQNGDIVIITGKGHEKSMCFGTTETPWSDQIVAKEILGEKYGR